MNRHFIDDKVKQINSDLVKPLNTLIEEKFIEQNNLTSSKINEVNTKIRTRKAGMQKKTIHNGYSDTIKTIFSANGTGTFILQGSKGDSASGSANIKVIVDGVPYATAGKIESGSGYKYIYLSNTGDIEFSEGSSQSISFSFNTSIVFEAFFDNTDLNVIFTYDYES